MSKVWRSSAPMNWHLNTLALENPSTLACWCILSIFLHFCRWYRCGGRVTRCDRAKTWRQGLAGPDRVCATFPDALAAVEEMSHHTRHQLV